ncbi:MAG: response regulator [Bryobacterales bacterium]|nr:response regulator [Bryobacterales bacterium]
MLARPVENPQSKLRHKIRKTRAPDLETAPGRLNNRALLPTPAADLVPVLGELVDFAIALSGADFGCVQLMDSASGDLRIMAQRGFAQEWINFWDNAAKEQGLRGTALEQRAHVIVDDVKASSSFAGPALEIQLKAGVRAFQSTPLIARSGKPIGVLSTHYRKPRRPDNRTLQLLDMLSRQAADAVENTRATVALRASEERLRQVLETDAIGLLFFDHTGTIIEANDVFLKMTGHTRTEVQRRELTWRRMTPPEWIEISGQQLAKLAATGRIGPYEKEYFLKDGSRRWMMFAGRDLGDGTISEYCVDITEHKKAETALHESEERFRALMNAGSYSVYRMSPGWEQMWFVDGKGSVADTAGTCGWLERYIPPDDQTRVMEAIERAIRTKSIFDLEHRVRRTDGTLGWTHSRAVPLLDANGEIREWFGAASDVTERKQAEAKLYEAHERLEALMRSLPVGVMFSNNPACTHVTGNSTVLALFGAGPEDNISARALNEDAFGRRVLYLQNGRPLSVAELPLQRAAREGRVIPPVELQVQLPDGRSRFLEVSGAPILGEQGNVIGGLAVIVDITARKRAEEDREQARLKDEFLAVLGHELRNPLAAISNAVQVLSGGVTAAQRASLDELIRRQVEFLRRLVDDLLDVSRITHGQIRLQKEGVDLSDLLRISAAAAQQAVAERAQTLVIRMPRNPVLFMADRVRMKQIAANLLDNASKYTDLGGTIELSGELEDSEVVIRCKDTGRGIPLEMQHRIFEPLIRLQTADQSVASGLGLGLTLVKRLAELHGGSVSVTSKGPGTGSEFVVRLPFLEPEPPLGEATTAPPPPHRALRLVLVEDNADVSRTMTAALEQAGHQVSRFADGPSALSGIEHLRPDAVLLDIGLPGMNGYEALARMRKLSHLRNTLFIAISGFQQSAATRKLRAGFDHYLVKPVDTAAILKLITGRAREDHREQPRVLLVEDHADLAAMTAELLRGEGFEVMVALTGRDAVDLGPRFQPQLILCDMNLPDMKGLEVARKLRAASQPRRVHVTMVTARSPAEIQLYNSEAQELGVDEFIPKPITPGVIRALFAKLDAR